jgi:8-oxo-dGTP diphosphatase
MEHVACAIFVRDQKILLAKRASHKRVAPDCWDLIGGHVEAGETVEQALVREAEEEVGLTPFRFSLTGSISQPKPEIYGEAVYHVFTVSEWSGGDPSMLGDEHTEIRWFTIDQACVVESLALVDYRNFFTTMRLKL